MQIRSQSACRGRQAQCEMVYLTSMKITNVEIKAHCKDPQRIRELLMLLGASYAGRDHQIDTYYRTPHGRLKLRQGNIENALIAYNRADVHDPKQSDILLYKTHDATGLGEILNRMCHVLVVVDKTRDIYFIGNTKFHIDEVKDLGTFVEIEAIDQDGSVDPDDLRVQVVEYMNELGISNAHLLTHSYSDMMLACV